MGYRSKKREKDSFCPWRKQMNGKYLRLLQNFVFSLLTIYRTTKILTDPKLKPFAEDKCCIICIFCRNGRKYCGEKGENAGDQHFLLLLQSFQKPFLYRSLKLEIVW